MRPGKVFRWFFGPWQPCSGPGTLGVRAESSAVVVAAAAVVAVAAVAVAAVVVVVVVVAVDQMFVAFFVAPDGAPSPRLCP